MADNDNNNHDASEGSNNGEGAYQALQTPTSRNEGALSSTTVGSRLSSHRLDEIAPGGNQRPDGSFRGTLSLNEQGIPTPPTPLNIQVDSAMPLPTNPTTPPTNQALSPPPISLQRDFALPPPRTITHHRRTLAVTNLNLNITTPSQAIPSPLPTLHDLLSKLTLPKPSELKPDDLSCPICQEPFLTMPAPPICPELPLRLPCSHVVGSGCILKWLNPVSGERNNTCPLCRKRPLKRTVAEEEEDGWDAESSGTGERRGGGNGLVRGGMWLVD